jgi:hypothetical protein
LRITSFNKKMLLLLTDFSHAVRSLRKSPALAAVAIASLSLGIGANVTVFSVVREMILDDLSAWRPDRLARVEGMDVSYTLYRELRTAGAFEDFAFHRSFGDRIWNTGVRSEIVWRMITSANFFDVLGIRPYAGRFYHKLMMATSSLWRATDSGANACMATRIRSDTPSSWTGGSIR